MAECQEFYQLHPDFEQSIVKFARGTTHFALNEVLQETEAELSEYYESITTIVKRNEDVSADCEPDVLEAYRLFRANMANRTLLISELGPLGTGFGHFSLVTIFSQSQGWTTCSFFEKRATTMFLLAMRL
jgi:hypothetical protein